jgi:hypothetical protein
MGPEPSTVKMEQKLQFAAQTTLHVNVDYTVYKIDRSIFLMKQTYYFRDMRVSQWC